MDLKCFGSATDSHIMVEIEQAYIFVFDCVDAGVINMVRYTPHNRILRRTIEKGIDRKMVDVAFGKIISANIPQELTDFLDEWFEFHTKKETMFPYA